MARFVIIGVIIAVAFILFALVDAAMSDASHARGVSKPVWVVIIVVLPVIGAVLWFMIGKGRGPAPVPARAPDDDPSFAGNRLSRAEIDAHVEELEARLRELDEETFPGVDGPGSKSGGGKVGGFSATGPNVADSNAAGSNTVDPETVDPDTGDANAAGPNAAGPSSTGPDGDTSGDAR